MSPIKFEENMKRELEQRTIPVTEGAWEKLQQRLDPEQPKKKGKSIVWVLGIAASLAFVFWLTKGAFEQSDVTPKIVEQPQEQETPSTENDTEVITPKKEEVFVAQDIKQPREEEEAASKIEESKPEAPVLNPQIHRDEVLLATNVEEVTPTENMSFEDQKVQEVVAQIVDLKEQNTTVSDAEIEALLEKAQREIEVKNLLIESSSTSTAGRVNPDMLLYEVEMELDKSFRTKVFEELKIQFNSVRNAVAQRNN